MVMNPPFYPTLRPWTLRGVTREYLFIHLGFLPIYQILVIFLPHKEEGYQVSRLKLLMLVERRIHNGFRYR